VLLAGRPDKHPGEFKERANQAGATRFVDPDLVNGTLTEGYQRLAVLDTAWERSVFAMFLVSEVHPFDDGNGRSPTLCERRTYGRRQMRTIIPHGAPRRLPGSTPTPFMFGEPTEVDINPGLEPSDRQATGAVRPYTRRDGTPVRGHSRNPRR
jgi:hypothetical protein